MNQPRACVLEKIYAVKENCEHNYISCINILLNNITLIVSAVNSLVNGGAQTVYGRHCTA